MQIRQLEMFINIYHTRSFARTARSMYLTQSRVSQRIKSMEKERAIPVIPAILSGLYLHTNPVRVAPIPINKEITNRISIRTTNAMQDRQKPTTPNTAHI